VAAHRIARDERIRGDRLAVDLVVARLLQREQRVAQRLREADERFGGTTGARPVSNRTATPSTPSMLVPDMSPK
jgi:hypothetical protein